jgi:hypothetical protein
MSTKLFLFASTAFLLCPANLLAGGPPLLCLPIDGVTDANAPAFVKRVTDALGDRAAAVELRRNEGRWYALLTYRTEVSLGELDAALKDTSFSIHRENLHLFGHLTLEMKIDEANAKGLIEELKRMKYVTVEGSECKKERLRVTVVMPYPPFFGSQRDDFCKEPFSKLTFGSVLSDFAPRNDCAATNRDLPGYKVLRESIEKHNGTLKDLRWSGWACRVLGGIAVTPVE